MAKRDNHKAARALAEWSLKSFKHAYLGQVAANHGIATSSLKNYLAALRTDKELVRLYEECLEALKTSDWVATLGEAMGDIVSRWREVAKASKNLPQLTEAAQAAADILLAVEIVKNEYSSEERRAPYGEREAAQVQGSASSQYN